VSPPGRRTSKPDAAVKAGDRSGSRGGLVPEQSVEPRDRTLMALDRISTAALEAGSLDELLGRLLHVLLDTAESIDTAAILLRENGDLVLRGSVGLDTDGGEDSRVPVGEGFSGRIAASQQPMLLQVTADDPQLKIAAIRRKGVRALFGIPLVDRGRVVGVVQMGSVRVSDFSEQDKQLLRALGSRATAAIVQHTLADEARTRARQQAAVADLGLRALAYREAQELFDDAVRVVSETLDTELSKVLELLPDRRTLFLRAGVGWTAGRVGAATEGAGTDSPSGYALLSNEPVIIDDLRTETRFKAPPLLVEHGVVSGMSAIIRAASRDDRAYGVLGTHTRRRRSFTRDDINFLRGAANTIAAALARMHAEHESSSRLRFLSEASRLLAESLDYHQTLSTIARVAVQNIATWCAIDILQDDALARMAIAHRDPSQLESVRTLQQRYPPRAGSSRGPYQVIHTGQSEFVPRMDERLLESVAVDAEHLRLLRGLGVRSYLCVPLAARGRVLGALTCVSDPSHEFTADDLAIAEDLARRAATTIDNVRLYDEAQNAARAREEVLAIVSHDLRNPLSVILTGAATQIGRAPADDFGRLVRKQAETIQRSAQRMSRLIDDLADISSIEAGRLAIERALEDPGAIVHETADAFQTAAAERGTRIVCEHGPDLPAAVGCDRQRIVQALSNIVGNAVNVTLGGAVTIRTDADTRELVFAVTDSGPGIAAEDLPHLFERHWRSKAAPYKGTGLGLAIAKGIVDAHGGRIWAESQVGRGSTFRIALPLN
jgi:signal transduction histidine kinase